MRTRKHEEIARTSDETADDQLAEVEAALDDDLGDELLALIFTACHPILSREARTALTLRVVGGLTTDEIARAFLTSEPTIAQRIVRAKRTIEKAGVAFAVRGDSAGSSAALGARGRLPRLQRRLRGHSSDDLIRPALAQEDVAAGTRARRADAPGRRGPSLIALMEIQASRSLRALAQKETSWPLTEQDRSRWDQLLIRRGLNALAIAEALDSNGPYVLQAALAACHARARHADDTEWSQIASLYDRLIAVVPSPIVDLNRAIAYGMAFGPEVGLGLLDGVAGAVALRDYAPLPAAKGDMLFRARRLEEARLEFTNAAALTRNTRERAFLLARANVCHPRVLNLPAAAMLDAAKAPE